MKKLIILRRFSQGMFFIVFACMFLCPAAYFLKGITASLKTVFSSNPNIIIFTSISSRIFLPGLIFSGLMLLLTLILGRFFCGWICPLGTVLDLTGALNKRRIILKDSVNKKLRKIKFLLLTVIFIYAIFGINIAWFFDPLGILARVLFVWQMLTRTTIMTIGLFLIIVSTAFFFSRLWCRSLCPLGAIYSIFARKSFLTRKVEKCSTCGVCRPACRMGAIKQDAGYVKGECVLCMDCVYACPEHRTKFGFRK
ncbi:MAG: 4Fe-4S binding protein [Candidatus Omnitrophota bacterium]